LAFDPLLTNEQAVVLSGLNMETGRRFPTCREFANALASAIDSDTRRAGARGTPK
jgi:hypothetical protein